MHPHQSSSQRCLIPIQIETLAGTSFELLVSPHEQIQYIKRKIERREGIPMSHQHLIWKTTELEDQSCLDDYQIGPGTTLKLVLTMRGGPVNTRRVPIEENLIRDMSEYMENGRDDYALSNELLPSSNKNVTFLVLRDGDQFNFFQVIDRGDGTLSPLSGSMSTTSMYNAHETLTVEPEREFDEKRQADDQKTKEKMELIRSKLKTHPRKDVLQSSRPSSSSKQNKSNVIHHHRRSIRIDTSSNISTNGSVPSISSPLEQQYRPLSYSYATTDLFNTYHLIATNSAHQQNYLHEEDTEDDDESQDDDDDEQSKRTAGQIFRSGSLSPSVFHRSIEEHRKASALLTQQSVDLTGTSAAETNNNAVLVDYLHHVSPATNPSDCPATAEQSASQTTVPSDDNTRKDSSNSIEGQNRNDTALSKTFSIDDDEQIPTPDDFLLPERTSTSQSILFRHPTSSTSTTVITPTPTLGNSSRKTPTTTTTPQFFHHHRNHQQFKSNHYDPSATKLPSSRPLVPLSLSKYRRISANFSSKPGNLIGTGTNGSSTPETPSNPPPTTEPLMLNKRIEALKTPGKQSMPQSTAPSPSTPVLPSPNTSKRHVPSTDLKSLGATSSVPSTPPSTLIPMDTPKVTIETIGPKTVSALLRQNATIEPVDTSRGVGKHLVSLLTTASKETGQMKTTSTHSKGSSQDVVIEERFKLDPKLANSWNNLPSNNPSTVSSSFQSNAATIYNTNKLPPVVVNRKSTSKCFLCKKKTGLATTYQCRCGSSFCSEHRYPEAHACAFDYKAEGKRLIERNNPLVSAPKLPKI